MCSGTISKSMARTWWHTSASRDVGFCCYDKMMISLLGFAPWFRSLVYWQISPLKFLTANFLKPIHEWSKLCMYVPNVQPATGVFRVCRGKHTERSLVCMRARGNQNKRPSENLVVFSIFSMLGFHFEDSLFIYSTKGEIGLVGGRTNSHSRTWRHYLTDIVFSSLVFTHSVQ